MHNRKPKKHKKQKTVIHSHRLVWCVLLGLICVFSQLSIHYYVIEIMQLCIMLFHTSWIFIISKSQNHEHLITKNTLYQLNLEGKKCHPAFLGDKNFRKDKSGNKPLDRYWQSYDQNIGGGGLVTKSCPTCDPKDCSLAGSSVHDILQVRILDWVATSFSRVSSQPRNQIWSPALQEDSLPTELQGKPL